MSIQRRIQKYQQKYFAPGSPLRYLRKAFLAVRHPAARAQRSRLGSRITAGLSSDAKQRVEALNETGYVDAGPEINQTLLEELARAAHARLEEGRDGKKIRSYFMSLTQKADLQPENIFVRFALQPAVQEIACAYFGGKVPYLADITLLLSHASVAEKWEESQLWHRDYADSKTIKLWVYLTDVTSPEKGPFTYLPVAASRKVRNRFFPRRVSDEAMSSDGLASQAVAVYGERLKSFYVDTSRCYHLGSRLKESEIRLAYVATFISHTPLYPFDNGIAVNSDLPEVERLLLSL